MLTVPQVMPLPVMKAGDAARLATKSSVPAGQHDDCHTDEVVKQVIANLKSQGYEDVDEAMVKSLASKMVTKATDPVITPQPYVAPTDFAAQYPQPLDPTEILTLCEEIGVLNFQDR